MGEDRQITITLTADGRCWADFPEDRYGAVGMLAQAINDICRDTSLDVQTMAGRVYVQAVNTADREKRRRNE